MNRLSQRIKREIKTIIPMIICNFCIFFVPKKLIIKKIKIIVRAIKSGGKGKIKER